MIRGDLSIEEDVNHAAMRKMLLRYETKKEAKRLATEWVDSDLVVIRLKPRKVIRSIDSCQSHPFTPGKENIVCHLIFCCMVPRVSLAL